MTSNPRFWQIGGVLAVLLAAYLSWMFVLAPVMHEADSARAQAVETGEQTERVQANIRVLAQQQMDLQAQVDALERLRAKIPKDVNVPRLMRTIQSEARVEGVQLDSLQPGQITLFQVTKPTPTASPSATGSEQQAPPAPAPSPSNLGQGEAPRNAGLAFVPLSLSGQGDYSSIQRLTSRLEQQQRAFLITMLDVQRETVETSKSPLTFTMEARVFVLNGDNVSIPASVQSGGE